jgi:ubiquinone/menaquinone biosynthesis C-methylase UbiE
MTNRSRIFVKRIWPYVKRGGSIVDIGCGNGEISSLLLNKGKYVAPVEAAKHRFIKGLSVTMYDGVRLPFPDMSFEIAILITVLHHTRDPEATLKEARRVAKKIIIIETSYTNLPKKVLTVFLDSIFNLQLNFQWQSYKTDREWRAVFKRLNLKVARFEKYRDFTVDFLFTHYLYILTS